MASGQKSRYERGKRRKKLCLEKGICIQCNQPKEPERGSKYICAKCAIKQSLYNRSRYLNLRKMIKNVEEKT